MGFFYIGDDGSVGLADHGCDLAVLLAGGEIDYAASPQLGERMADHIDAGIRRLVLDMSTVTFIDSTAIGVLVAAALRLRELGGFLAIVCGAENTRVHRIFEIAGIDGLIALRRTREEVYSENVMAG